MATRRRIASEEKLTAPEPSGQRARAEQGQFRLQVDRQTKASYETNEAAEQAGLAIKRGHPILRVEIFDAAAGMSKVIELSEEKA